MKVARYVLNERGGKVTSPSTLTNYAKMRGAEALIRGLRVLSDFEMELQMAHTNKTLSSEIETVFLATSNEYSFLSSSLVKEIAKFGGQVDGFVPKHVAIDIYKCYDKNKPVSNPSKTDISAKPNLPTERQG